MDHSEAVRLQAAEKYLLGELSKEQREGYEEHYFDCPTCAEELRMTVAFMESARQVAQEEVPELAAAGLERHPFGSRGWFDALLKPAFAIPVFAALLLIIGYQNGVTIPGLKQSSSHVATAEVVKSFSLMSVGSRGEGSASLSIAVSPKEDFGLDVDMPGNSASGYLCEIQDDSGKVLFTLPVSAEAAKQSVHINIPGGSLKPGKYTFAIITGQASIPETGHSNVAAQLPFNIEFVR
jgi:hypothetical protein